MADVKRLKTGKTSGPPAAAAAPGNIQYPPRDKTVSTKPLQFKVPEKMFLEFSKRAGEEFGYTKGGKLALFMKIWEQYSNSMK